MEGLMEARLKPVISASEYSEKLKRKDLSDDAASLFPDPTPIAPPVGYIKQPSIAERIRDMVRSEHLRLAAESAGVETFEEADDFEVGDDYDPSSPYEEVFEPPSTAEPPKEVSTGVPPSSGGGEGAGGAVASPPAAEPASPVSPAKGAPGPT